MSKHLRTFYILLVTQGLSLIGSRMTAVAVGIWVFNETRSAAPLLLASFFAELPGMLGGSIAGVWVDRWNRRWVMALADMGQAAGTLLLLGSFLSGHFQVWHLYTVSFLQGVFSIFQGPAQNAVITVLVPEALRERANAIREMVFPLAGVAAPVFAGLVYALAGVSGVVAIDLATFLAAVGVVIVSNIPAPPRSAEGLAAQGSFWKEMRAGLGFIASRRALLVLVIYGAWINFLLNGPLELNIPYLISVTGSEQTMGVIMGLTSLGAFTGAGLIAVWGGRRPRMYILLGGMAFAGAMFLVYGLARSPWALAVAIYLLMIPLPMGNALFMSILQAKTPPDLQGRVFGAIAQLNFLGSTSSFLLVGPLVDRWLEPAVGTPGWGTFEPLFGASAGAGMGLLLFVTGGVILISTLLVFAWPPTRRLEAVLPDYPVNERPDSIEQT